MKNSSGTVGLFQRVHEYLKGKNLLTLGTSLMSRPREIKEYYEKHPMGETQAEWYDEIKETLKGQRYDFVLDIGCGSSYLGKTISMLCNDYIGIDLSSKNIECAKKVYENGQYIVGDILHLPIKHEISDLVVCSEVLEHVSKYEKAIEELSRVLKNYGNLIITTPNYFNSLIYYSLRVKGRGVTAQIYDRPIPYPRIFRCLRDNNFRVEHFRSFHLCYLSFAFTPKTLRKKILKLLCFLDRIISFPLGLYVLIKSKKFLNMRASQKS